MYQARFGARTKLAHDGKLHITTANGQFEDRDTAAPSHPIQAQGILTIDRFGVTFIADEPLLDGEHDQLIGRRHY